MKKILILFASLLFLNSTFVIAEETAAPDQKMKPTYLIRPIKQSEGDTLYTLICEHADHEHKEMTSLSLTKENLLLYGFGDKPRFKTEVAVVGTKIVGYAVYYYTFSVNHGCPVLYIEELYIKPEFQKYAIGSSLLKRLIHYGKKHKCGVLEWHVFDWNKEQVDFMEHKGSNVRRDMILVRLTKEKDTEEGK